ncbi:type 1 glutamine amidotransferase [Pandoraea sp.]|uniref:type 1 glutamine amidotransferase n=1 Tax=Pandoraea sp. TaxID=1883445 RepID=UPI0025FD8700|nr:gamma-glutamyl-gamma-aminobutyrate hydrolase family protein [Pandoraea sp.]
MEAWLRERDARITYSHLYESPALPAIGDLADLDLLIALGGPMSVNDEVTLPWLRPEKLLLATAIERGVAVLGVCLGAQLIATALGARVYAAKEKEIGWHTISGTPHGTSAFRFPAEVEVFHWHGETFDLPATAVHLASSTSCANQAFQIGSNVIGLQFHLEVTRAGIDRMLDHGRAEMTNGQYVQSEREIQSVHESRYATVQTLMSRVLDHLVARSSAWLPGTIERHADH